MNVLMLSPGFPDEMPKFAEGLAAVGARVIGVGEQPQSILPPRARRALDHYIQVRSLWDEPAVIRDVRAAARDVRIDRVECLWEPGIMLAAALREALEVPGMSVAQSRLFRDKGEMKRRLDSHGIRTPHHRRATNETEIRRAVDELGYPLIIKPIAGAGSADTHRVSDSTDLEQVLPQVRHVRELSVEEFIDGEELTFDTICAGGKILYRNVAWYRPQPLIARTVEWVSPQTIGLRDPGAREVSAGVEMGRRVLEALQFDTGFTHMEWFLTDDGEAVFGEIGGRPPGARSVELMNYCGDFSSYYAWAEAVCTGRIERGAEPRYNSAVIFKRAHGEGRIRRISGLERLIARYRREIVCVDLLPVGAHRRNWKQTLISDGYLIVRHPDLQATLEIADRVGTDLQLFAG